MSERTVLTINTGSSSLKAAVFDAGDLRDRHLTAQVEHIGHASALIVVDGTGQELANEPLVARDHGEALSALIDWLQNHGETEPLAAIGHRLVHGGREFSAPALIDGAMVAILETLIPFAPNHMPQALAAIAATRRAFPALPQVACFDTAFHRTMPPVAQRYPLPPEFERDGVIRYGFHGLSYASIVDQLGDRIQPRTVIAHLGNGASMVALRDGKSIDTTMGFTPLGGLMMGTRSGDLDPGVLLYLLEQTGKTVDEVADLVTNQAGLRGVSQRSADMKTLLEHENDDPQTAAALELYVSLARKQLGGLLAVLGGLDLLVFTGGIGEHAAEIRERIGAGFEFAGIRIDPAKNDPTSQEPHRSSPSHLSSRAESRDLSLPEHPSSTGPTPPTVILNEVKDLSRSDVPETLSSFENPSTLERGSGQPRGEILRFAQNDSAGASGEPETRLPATRGLSTSVETTGGGGGSESEAGLRATRGLSTSVETTGGGEGSESEAGLRARRGSSTPVGTTGGAEGSELEAGLRATRGSSTPVGTTRGAVGTTRGAVGTTRGAVGMADGTEISYDDGPVRVLVLPSDEERMIARDTVRLIARKDLT